MLLSILKFASLISIYFIRLQNHSFWNQEIKRNYQFENGLPSAARNPRQNESSIAKAAGASPFWSRRVVGFDRSHDLSCRMWGAKKASRWARKDVILRFNTPQSVKSKHRFRGVFVDVLRSLKEKPVGGAEGIRTPDPHNAIVVLYQLSYDPNRFSYFKERARFVKAFAAK